MEMPSPHDMLARLGAACPGCSGNPLPTFKADMPAVSSRPRATVDQPSDMVQRMANRDILQLNRQLQNCLHEQLRLQQKTVSLRGTLQRLEEQVSCKRTAHQHEINRLRLSHERELQTIQQASFVESQRLVQEQSMLQREQEQGWVQVTRLRHAINRKAEENRQLDLEVKDLWDGIRKVGAHNQELIKMVGRKAEQSRLMSNSLQQRSFDSYRN